VSLPSSYGRGGKENPTSLTTGRGERAPPDLTPSTLEGRGGGEVEEIENEHFHIFFPSSPRREKKGKMRYGLHSRTISPGGGRKGKKEKGGREEEQRKSPNVSANPTLFSFHSEKRGRRGRTWGRGPFRDWPAISPPLPREKGKNPAQNQNTHHPTRGGGDEGMSSGGERYLEEERKGGGGNNEKEGPRSADNPKSCPPPPPPPPGEKRGGKEEP